MLKNKVVTAGLVVALTVFGGAVPALAQPTADTTDVVLVTAEDPEADANEIAVAANDDSDDFTTVEQDGITYHVYGDHVVLSHYGNSTSADVVVPATVSGQPVTAIGAQAFKGDTGLRSIAIPDGVTAIGYFSFQGCTGLQSITFPASVTKFGFEAFFDCGALKTVRIEATDIVADSWVFSGIAQGSTISVPTYKTGEQLHDFLLAPASYDASKTTVEVQAQNVPVYRLYNPYTGEHLFTTGLDEYNNLVAAGWSGEGQAWAAPSESLTPVYRLYNPYSGDHHYTADEGEYEHLGQLGWNKEGVMFYSASERLLNGASSVYRLYNPWLAQGSHFFTTSKAEYDNLVAAGWSGEGRAFYAFTD